MRRKVKTQRWIVVAYIVRLVLIVGIAAAAAWVRTLSWPAIFGIGSVVVIWQLRRLAFSASDVLGSAKYAAHGELEKAGMLGEDGLILARSAPVTPSLFRAVLGLFTFPGGQSVLACQRFAAAFIGGRWFHRPLIRVPNAVHVLTVAPAGAGKGVGQIIPSLLLWRQSVVVLDPKGENYQKTAATRRRMGQEVYKLDPFTVCGSSSARFNPLDLIEPASERAVNDADSLAEALVVRGQESESYWNDCAQTCLQACILFVVYHAPAEEKNLLTVRELIASDADTWAGTLALMKNSDAAGGALRRLGHHMGNWIEKELASIKSAANRHLAFLDSPPIARCLSTSSFDPRDLVQRQVSVYIVLPPDLMTPLARLLRLWLTSFVNRLFQQSPQEENLVLFLLDEVGQLGALRSLEQAVTVGRGYGLRIWFFLQGLPQLQKLFPENKAHLTVQANMSHQIFYGIRDLETAKEVSAYVGRTTVTTISQGSSTSVSHTPLTGRVWGGNPTTQVSSGSSSTTSQQARELLMPEEILKMPANVGIIFAKEMNPIAAQIIR